MKRTLWVFASILIAVALLVTSLPVQAQSSVDPLKEPYAGLPLCLPDAYPQGMQDCLALGPSTLLTDLAKKGLTFPPLPLPASHPDPALSELPVRFARLSIPDDEPAGLFGSLEQAVLGQNPLRKIPPGPLRFVSFTQWVDVNGGHYLLLKSGEWVRASPLASYSQFQGLVFQENPKQSFGWIVEDTVARSTPSFQAPETGMALRREQLVQIYDVQEAQNTKWYLIGVNQWVERRYIRQVVFNPTPPAGVDNNRWIEINLYEQTLTVYENGRLLFATLIASGLDPFFTKPGLFKIYEKKPLETMSGAFEADRSDYYYLEDVPWTMYYDEARALHGAYWRAWFGYPQSHGCVNMSISDSRWLFDWAKVGDWVFVWDPSGQTPTDPKLYTPGGA